MEYCGLDLGRRSSRYCIVDNARDVVQEGDVRTHKTHYNILCPGMNDPTQSTYRRVSRGLWRTSRSADALPIDKRHSIDGQIFSTFHGTSRDGTQ